jgi:hypothetical protein
MDDGFGDMPGAGWLNASSPGYNGGGHASPYRVMEGDRDHERHEGGDRQGPQ